MRQMKIDIHRYNLVQTTGYLDETYENGVVQCPFSNKTDTRNQRLIAQKPVFLVWGGPGGTKCMHDNFNLAWSYRVTSIPTVRTRKQYYIKTTLQQYLSVLMVFKANILTNNLTKHNLRRVYLHFTIAMSHVH